jgi:hypothetical protein
MIKFIRATKESRPRDEKRKRILLCVDSRLHIMGEWGNPYLAYHISQKEGKKLYKQLGKLLRRN